MPFITVSMLPDTGFHRVFLPLFLDQSTKEEEKWLEDTHRPPNIPTSVRNSIFRLVNDQGYIQSVNRQWLRMRFDKVNMPRRKGRPVEVYGVMLAVETNLGDINRGYRMRTRDVRGSEREDKAEIDSAYDQQSPYVAKTTADLDKVKITHVDLIEDFRLDSLIDSIGEVKPNNAHRGTKGGDSGESPLTVRINWLDPKFGEPIRVSIIVDFGNSRTSVLALEDIHQDGLEFGLFCRPIIFNEGGNLFEGADYVSANFDEVLPESWFMLQENPFADLDQSAANTVISQKVLTSVKGGVMNRARIELDKVVERRADMFRQLSPAVIGQQAKRLLSNCNLSPGGQSFLSSPKRYIWDYNPVARDGSVVWTMQPQDWNRSELDDVRPRRLSGEILQFMTRDLELWDEDDPPYMWPPEHSPARYDYGPDHPRAAGLVWTALSILETAYQQINSHSWRAKNQPQLRRVLDKIVLSCPAGWTEEEIASFTDLWRLARHIFYYSRHFDLEDPVPIVVLALDEAVAAQVPFVYSEIRHLGYSGGLWIQLYGRKRNGQDSVRVMTIDIGGGTTDTSIIEYINNAESRQARLQTELIFRQSTTIAGDRLVKAIIEEVLLPTLIPADASRDEREVFGTYFRRIPGSIQERQERSITIRLVFIPIVLHWLRELSDMTSGVPAAVQAASPSEMGVDLGQVEKFNALMDDEGFIGFEVDPYVPMHVDFDKIRAILIKWLDPLLQSHENFVAAFGCDLVVLSGKPSEQRLIQELFQEHLPLFPERILTAKNYYAGDWPPFSGDGYIPDAKLVTSLGLAVRMAIANGQITTMSMDPPKLNEPYENHWGIMQPNRPRFFEDDVFLARGERQAAISVGINTFIGKAMFLEHSRPEQVYRIKWRGPRDDTPNTVRVTLRRVRPDHEDGPNVDMDEGLVLLSADIIHSATDHEPTDLVDLELCTLPNAEEHWLDSGKFDLDIDYVVDHRIGE